MLCMWCVSPLEICRISSHIKHCMTGARVLLNVCNYLVFVGEGWLTLVPSHLPHLRLLCLECCSNVCKYVELVAAIPNLRIEPSLSLCSRSLQRSLNFAAVGTVTCVGISLPCSFQLIPFI
jgi:hypothetical protein